MRTKQTLALFFYLTLIGCGSEEPYTITSAGIRLHNRGSAVVQAWQVEFLTEILLEEFDGGDAAKDAVNGINAYFYAELPDVKTDVDDGRAIAGYAESKKGNIHILIDERREECLAISALQHEIMHVIEYQLKGRTDSNHTDCGYWCPARSAKGRGITELCGEL